MSAASRARLVEAAWLRELHSGAVPAAARDDGAGAAERDVPVLVARTNGRPRDASGLRA